MDVDISDKEVIIYLHRNDLKTLKSQNRISKNIVTNLKEESTGITVDYDESTDFSDEKVYDDVIDALEEIDSMLWELQETLNSFEEVKEDYNWKKVMRTYEYYDNIRSQYE